MKKAEIDGGKEFDWGRAPGDYARWRDIYPSEFYRRILDAGLCGRGQTVLDLGTGTGVLPRNLYGYGARFVGTDVSAEQIEQARRLSTAAGQNTEYRCVGAEEIDFEPQSFDTVTACQCFFYFDHAKTAPKLYDVLKKSGRLALLYMAWLPSEDRVAGASEALILRCNPSWSGCGETRHPIAVPTIYENFFETEQSVVFDLDVPFTRESWHGRIMACRGVGASLDETRLREFDAEHRALLARIAPESFVISHYAAMTILRVKK